MQRWCSRRGSKVVFTRDELIARARTIIGCSSLMIAWVAAISGFRPMYRNRLSMQPSMMTNQPDPRSKTPVLRVGAALPDPPFEFMTKNGPAGFDIMLMKRIAEILGCEWQLVPYDGGDFNGI